MLPYIDVIITCLFFAGCGLTQDATAKYLNVGCGTTQGTTAPFYYYP
jgi:hypothetical protein